MMLKAIHDKLAGSKDIAVVALQKAHGTDVGRGGDFGLEKPRLALAMESGRVKIVKAKFWKNSLKNPNGLYKEYDLVNGCKIINETDWFYDDDRKLFKRR